MISFLQIKSEYQIENEVNKPDLVSLETISQIDNCFNYNSKNDDKVLEESVEVNYIFSIDDDS